MSRKKVVEIKKKFRENNMNFNFTKKTSSIKKVSKTCREFDLPAQGCQNQIRG